MNDANITLGEIDNGNLVLQVNSELAKIIRDIADPNKQATKTREVNLKISFKPAKSRKEATLEYLVTSKPSVHIVSESTIFLGKDANGDPIAKPYVPNQQNLYDVAASVGDTEIN